MTQLSLFAQHVERWKDGCGSSICEGAKKCIARGSVPCDVVFVGEAPGESENHVGCPFKGPAGHLLDYLIRRSFPKSITYALTNLVCCIPREDTGGIRQGGVYMIRGQAVAPGLITGKAEAPLDDDIRCCAPRLQEFIAIASPKLVICVGALARDWLDPAYKHHIDVLDSRGNRIPRIDITHPAAILRANVAQKGFLTQRVMVNLQNCVEDYLL